MIKRGLFIASVLVLSLNAKPSLAITTYEFTGTIDTVNTWVSGYPTVLQGINVGDSLTGSYSYNGDTLPSVNSSYSNATSYSVPNTFSLTINDIPIPIGEDPLSIYVWNDSVISVFPLEPTYGDGYLIENAGSPYYFKFGSNNLSTDALGNESLPTASINGSFGFLIYDLGPLGFPKDPYLTASVGPLIASNPVPVPPAIWLFGSGLLGLVGIGRKRFKK